MEEIRVLTPTGMLGYGFSLEAFRRGLAKKPHVIAVDSGSTDSGPQKLGNGSLTCPYEAYERAIGVLLDAWHETGIPVYISSAGGAGSDVQVDLFIDLIKRIAAEKKYRFQMAVIRGELDKGLVKAKLKQGRIRPCGPVEDLTDQEVEASNAIVAQMGVEPFLKAMETDAEIIVSGRAYDPVPIAAPGVKHGFDPGLAWHMGKIMECGALCAGDGRNPIIGTLRRDHFVIEPLMEGQKATVTSVAAHTLYEKGHPYLLPGPGGTIDLSQTVFEQIDERCVKVSQSRFIPADPYTVKLEGSRQVGYRSMFVAGMRDPIAIRRIDSILAAVGKDAAEYFRGKDYQIIFHVYGKNGVMGEYEPRKEATPHELGIVCETVAQDQLAATAVCARARVTLLHYPYEGRIATGGNVGFVFTPLEIPLGEVYKFNVYHLMEVDDPCEYFPIELHEVGKEA